MVSKRQAAAGTAALWMIVVRIGGAHHDMRTAGPSGADLKA
jgi:hypothetical protein